MKFVFKIWVTWGIKTAVNNFDISSLKTSRAFDVLIHSGKPHSVG